MSKDAVARAYIRILNDRRGSIQITNFEDAELSAHEREMLQREAGSDSLVSDEGPVMSYLRGGAPLAPRLASDLGVVLNRIHGLPTGSLTEPGYRSSSQCCPWGHPKIPDPHGMLE
ncbi:MAG TPA: hypothetical protein VGK90_11350 [Rhizomicrobium sp.]|jgi:hypothetical protein